MSQSKRIHTMRAAALTLCLLLAAALLTPVAARAQEARTVVRVGWYETPYNQTDSFGRRSGYAYEYQQKIAAYTGWTYEYVNGSWPELLQMLIDGEIDLMSDISYTVGRAKSLLYSMLPMGEEEYYVYIAAQATAASTPTTTRPSRASGSASTQTASRRTCSSNGRPRRASRRSWWSWRGTRPSPSPC